MASFTPDGCAEERMYGHKNCCQCVCATCFGVSSTSSLPMQEWLHPPVWLTARCSFLGRVRREFQVRALLLEQPPLATPSAGLPSSTHQPRRHGAFVLRNFQPVCCLQGKSQTLSDSKPSALWPLNLSVTFFPTISKVYCLVGK